MIQSANSTHNCTANCTVLRMTSAPPSINRTLTIARIVSYVIIGSFILFGSTLCLAAFLRTRTLRKRSYFLLISLSVADLLVGISAVVICAEDGLSLYRGQQDLVFSFWRDVSQYLPRMTSLFTVAAVAVERFWAVGYPTKHRSAGVRPYAALVTVPWILALCLSILYILGNRIAVYKRVFNISDVVLSQVTLLTIIIAYCGLALKMKRNQVRRNQERKALRERKLAITLFVLTLASVVTIYPVNIYFLIQILHSRHSVTISEHLFLFLIALASCNSAINIVVYMFRIPEFKRAVLRLLFGRCQTARVSCVSKHDGVAAISENHFSFKQETTL